MTFTPERAAIRFGCGLSPTLAPPQSVDDMLALLGGADQAAENHPIPGMDPVWAMMKRERVARRALRAAKSSEDKDAANKAIKAERRGIRTQAAGWFGQSLMRRAQSEDGFRERLVSFWADHFTARGKRQGLNVAQTNYAEDAIRPHLTGRFSELLKASVTHPVMLSYLDQSTSIGPNSRAAKRDPRRGLNENLARELLELHSLGVDGPYTQTDVRQLAELLTGLSFDIEEGFRFRQTYVEPGTKTVLGRNYGGADRLAAIHEVLDRLAIHPATARHLAGKLAVHFVGDRPDAALVNAMEARFLETGGDLMAVYEALLSHPSSWNVAEGNVKQPIDFIGSTLRALDLHQRQMPAQKLGRMRKLFINPMTLMGQRWGVPTGPDGWPEADESWITPQRLAARLQWAMVVPRRLKRTLPDPRQFVDVALGGLATEQIRFAARASETRFEGVGVILSSAAFQRM